MSTKDTETLGTRLEKLADWHQRTSDHYSEHESTVAFHASAAALVREAAAADALSAQPLNPTTLVMHPETLRLLRKATSADAVARPDGETPHDHAR